MGLRVCRVQGLQGFGCLGFGLMGFRAYGVEDLGSREVRLYLSWIQLTKGSLLINGSFDVSKWIC